MMHCKYFDTTRKGNHSATLTPIVVGEQCPLPSEICAQSDPPPFEKCRLLPISACNVSTVRDSKKGSIMSNIKSARAFQRAIDGERTLPLSPERVAQKAFFFFSWNKSQLQSNKVCYKVSLCENFQQQSCSTTISVSNGP